jgi:phosphate-selective porin OprO and OprP
MLRRLAGRCLMGAGALVLALSAVTSVFAQGMFYAEETKDGRVYVFNNKANWERFKASGETGTGLTRLNAGPGGETVYADNETALELYYFKHGITEKVDRPAAPKAVLSYRDGQTTAEFDKGQVTFTNRLQLRFTEQLPDDTVQLAGTAAKGDGKPSFRIRRYEPQFQGWIYSKDLTYKLEFAFQDLQGNTNSGAINDAYFNYDFTKGKKQFRLQLGQYKVPFGRQEMTSSFNLQFVDRSIVAGEFEKGRDLGVMVDGLLANQKVAWYASAVNGNGRNQTANDNDKLQYNARVQFQPLGVVAYSEADFETTDKPLFSVAGQYEQNSLFNTTTANDLKREIFGGDAVFKYKGLFVQGEYFNRKFTPETGVSYKSNGYNAEAGYAFSRRKWEVAFRYSSWDPTDLKADDDRSEIGGAVNWFYNRHFAKIQADFRQIENKAAKTKDKEFRIQTQLYF